MKLINLLLLGFLSTVSFLSLLACSDDTVAPSSPLRIVADIDNKTPEFYENTAIKIKAVDMKNNLIKATWNATDIDGVDLSFDPVTGINSETITIKITDKATAKGVINAKINIDGSLIETNITIIPSTIALKSIKVLPVDTVIKLVKDKGSVTLTALATFENNREVDITKDTVWSMQNTPDITLNVDTGTVTATAVVTSPSIVTGTFTSGTVEKKSESAITSELDTIAKITVTVDNNGTLKLPLGATKQLKAEATYTGGLTEDVTNEVSWTTSKAEVIMVDNDNGVITSKKVSGEAVITARSSNDKTDEITITGSAPELESVTIKPFDITTTDPKTVELELSNSDRVTAPTDIDATDFKWTVTLVGGGDAKDIAEINATTGVITAKAGVTNTEINISATLNDNIQPVNLPTIRVEPITVNVNTP